MAEAVFSGFAQSRDRRGGAGRDEPPGCGSTGYEISELVGRQMGGALRTDRLAGAGRAWRPLARQAQPHRAFLEAREPRNPTATLQALCDRLLAERGVKADTSMMSRFFRRIGVTFKKRRSWRVNRIGAT